MSSTAGPRNEAEISSKPIKQGVQNRVTVESNTAAASQNTRQNEEKVSTLIEHDEASISPTATQPLQRNLRSGVPHTQAQQYGVKRSSETYPRVAASLLQQNFSYGGHTEYEDPIQQSQSYDGVAGSPLARQGFNFGANDDSAYHHGVNDSYLRDTPPTPFGLWNDLDTPFQRSPSLYNGQPNVTPAVFDSDYIVRDWVHYAQAFNLYET